MGLARFTPSVGKVVEEKLVQKVLVGACSDDIADILFL
jgi:hypothetical protein